jgi:transcriptional regulator with XRE-family HTH domain
VPSLALFRKRAALSQGELAARAGVGRATISRLERGGSASFETIERLAKALRKERTQLTQKPRPATNRKHQRATSQG